MEYKSQKVAIRSLWTVCLCFYKGSVLIVRQQSLITDFYVTWLSVRTPTPIQLGLTKNI